MAYSILVVEDNDALRGQISATLEIEGYKVITAVNGLEGLECARQSPPSLVICDVTMPRMDGLEMLRQVRQQPGCAKVPVIFLSARVTRNDVRKGMDLGADDYLTKPVRIDELIGAVVARLRRQEEQSQASEDIRAKMLKLLSHELRTPLNGIVGGAEVLDLHLKSTGLSEIEIDDMLEIIQASGKRLEDLITNLTLYYQLELADEPAAGPDSTAADRSPAPLCETITQTAWKIASRHSRVEDLRWSPEDEHEVALNADSLPKVLREIIDNAFKFSAPGTLVEIQVTKEAKAMVVEVLDRGVGINVEESRQMQPFEQWHRQEREQQGMGLGFFIARKLAESANGTVTLAPREGGGAVARIQLPLAV